MCHRIARALRVLQQPAPVVLLSRLHHAETLAERSKAATILGALGDLQAFAPLLTILNTTQEDPSVRSAAVCALYELNAKQAVEPLITVLASDSSRIVRAHAASVFKESRQPPVLAALLNALADEATIVRVAATTSLHDFGDPQIIPALQAMIASEIAHDDDFEDYLLDLKSLPGDMMLTDQLPEAHAQNVLDFIQA